MFSIFFFLAGTAIIGGKMLDEKIKLAAVDAHFRRRKEMHESLTNKDLQRKAFGMGKDIINEFSDDELTYMFGYDWEKLLNEAKGYCWDVAFINRYQALVFVYMSRYGYTVDTYLNRGICDERTPLPDYPKGFKGDIFDEETVKRICSLIEYNVRKARPELSNLELRLAIEWPGRNPHSLTYQWTFKGEENTRSGFKGERKWPLGELYQGKPL